MANKMESYFQITENGFTAVFQGSPRFSEFDELYVELEGNLSCQQVIVDEVLGSRWNYDPTEETHKVLPYPYCS